ncbi:MAG: NeuD/PglB/VioB family sugar acetyltransferase [Candidatus Thiodiazotropha endolucinida]|uniref:NeuD/PglB/VioB family sugar acetyltransferase n=1 Tax=Candidatus Thiodiazotropha taylori TaxID=2792791 RepID=A0A9E4NLI3_9GAMM|nr:NeuD/PglB/VioB family sugar acetyltransferase [Candidatus Thiodiazotropha taylori]MCW4237740.1 NeuD/PglB/VioB family sugar acetyltransferase [Candidatus Thiodiazotropha endolucinida]
MSEINNNKPLVIIGSGGHACCLKDVAQLAGLSTVGFIDRTRSKGEIINQLPILGGDELLHDISFISGHLFAVGIGSPIARRRYGELLLKKQADCPAIVNPSSFVSPHAILGSGVLLMGMNAVNHGARLDDFVALDWQVTIGHGAHLGRAVFAGPGSRVAGDVICGEETYLGLGCQVIERVRIGRGSLIGAGSTVTRDIPERMVAVGSPAKAIRQHSEEEVDLGPRF